MVAAGESLRGQGAEKFGERARVFEPSVKVARAGLDDGAGVEAICGEPGEGWLVEVVEEGEAVFAGWAEADVRVAEVMAFERGKPV